MNEKTRNHSATNPVNKAEQKINPSNIHKETKALFLETYVWLLSKIFDIQESFSNEIEVSKQKMKRMYI